LFQTSDTTSSLQGTGPQRFPKELFEDGKDFQATYRARKKDLGEAKE